MPTFDIDFIQVVISGISLGVAIVYLWMTYRGGKSVNVLLGREDVTPRLLQLDGTLKRLDGLVQETDKRLMASVAGVAASNEAHLDSAWDHQEALTKELIQGLRTELSGAIAEIRGQAVSVVGGFAEGISGAYLAHKAQLDSLGVHQEKVVAGVIGSLRTELSAVIAETSKHADSAVSNAGALLGQRSASNATAISDVLEKLNKTIGRFDEAYLKHASDTQAAVAAAQAMAATTTEAVAAMSTKADSIEAKLVSLPGFVQEMSRVLQDVVIHTRKLLNK